MKYEAYFLWFVAAAGIAVLLATCDQPDADCAAPVAMERRP